MPDWRNFVSSLRTSIPHESCVVTLLMKLKARAWFSSLQAHADPLPRVLTPLTEGELATALRDSHADVTGAAPQPGLHVVQGLVELQVGQ